MSKIKIFLASVLLFFLAVSAPVFGEEIEITDETPITLPSPTTPPVHEVSPQEALRKFALFMGGFFVAAMLLFAIGILCMVFWILMIIHAATKPIDNKALWIVILALTGIVGAIIYYFAVKRKFDQKEKTAAFQVPSQGPQK